MDKRNIKRGDYFLVTCTPQCVMLRAHDCGDQGHIKCLFKADHTSSEIYLSKKHTVIYWIEVEDRKHHCDCRSHPQRCPVTQVSRATQKEIASFKDIAEAKRRERIIAALKLEIAIKEVAIANKTLELEKLKAKLAELVPQDAKKIQPAIRKLDLDD